MEIGSTETRLKRTFFVFFWRCSLLFSFVFVPSPTQYISYVCVMIQPTCAERSIKNKQSCDQPTLVEAGCGSHGFAAWNMSSLLLKAHPVHIFQLFLVFLGVFGDNVVICQLNQSLANVASTQPETAGRSGLAVACLTAVREVPGSNRAVGSCVYRTTTVIYSLGHGLCAPFLQCLGQLSLLPSVGW